MPTSSSDVTGSILSSGHLRVTAPADFSGPAEITVTAIDGADHQGEFRALSASMTFDLMFANKAIHGRKFDDLDGDGAQDEGESGLPHWTIFRDDDLDGEHDAADPGIRSTRIRLAQRERIGGGA